MRAFLRSLLTSTIKWSYHSKRRFPLALAVNVFAACLPPQAKKHGRDYLLIHSPERIKSGSMRAQLTRNPKIIGGVNAEAKDAGVALYRRFIPEAMIRPVETIEAA